jgi:hypothetical protein
MRPYLQPLLLPLFAVLILPTAEAGEVQDSYSLQLVRTCIKERSMGLYTATAAKLMPRLGDKVGIAIVKIYTSSDIMEPKTVRLFLPVIQMAFQYPRLISDEEDRKPAVTMLLLNYLRGNVREGALKEEISRVEDQVLQMTTKSPPS